MEWKPGERRIVVGNIWGKSKQSWKGTIGWDVPKESVEDSCRRQIAGGTTEGLA